MGHRERRLLPLGHPGWDGAALSGGEQPGKCHRSAWGEQRTNPWAGFGREEAKGAGLNMRRGKSRLPLQGMSAEHPARCIQPRLGSGGSRDGAASLSPPPGLILPGLAGARSPWFSLPPPAALQARSIFAKLQGSRNILVLFFAFGHSKVALPKLGKNYEVARGAGGE